MGVQAPPAVMIFLPLTLFHSTKSENRKQIAPVTTGMMKADVTALLYASSTPGSCSGITTSRICVAPAATTAEGFTSGAYWGSFWISLLRKMFWAAEMEIAPPRVLKKMVIASASRAGCG